MRLLTHILLAALLVTAAEAQQPRAVQASTAAASRDQITADFKVGSGRTVSFLVGSTIDIDGAFSGSPTGGTLDLSLLSLTLPEAIRVPSAVGNSGKVLTSNGTTWTASDGGGLPDQTGNNGKFLTTNGSAASWATLAGGGDLLSTNNLSDLTNAATARTNLALGSSDSPTFSGLTLSSLLAAGNGRVRMFGTPATASTQEYFEILPSVTLDDTQDRNKYGTRVQMQLAHTGATTNVSWAHGALLGEILTEAANTHTYSNRQTGTYSYINHQGAGVMSLPIGSYSVVAARGAGGMGTARAFDAHMFSQDIEGTGAVTSMTGLNVRTVDELGGAIGSIYGVYVAEQTAADANYAIYTAGSTPSYFGGPLTTANHFTLLRSGAYDASLSIGADTSQSKSLIFTTAGSRRWALVANNAVESGSNAGSDLRLTAYDDADTAIDNPITITRAAGGNVTVARPIVTSQPITSSNVLTLLRTGAVDSSLTIGADAGRSRSLLFTTGALRRWAWVANDVAESGSDAGSNLRLSAYADDDTPIDSPITITRASGGTVAIARPVTVTSLNGITLTGASTPALTVTGTASVAGSNTGDQTITMSGDVSGSGTGAITATLATVNSNVGSFGSATAVPAVTVNAKGLITAASNTTIAIPATAISDSTAAGRTLVTAADAAAQRTALSLGNVENTALSTWAGSTNIVTTGNITTGTWSGTTIAVNKGGTSQTSYTNGQLLIGNTTSGGLDKATLTAGTGITITNGAGSITINATTSGGAVTLAQNTTQTGPVNTTSETAIFTFDLPTNLSAGDTLRLTLAGQVLNNTGSNKTITIRVKLGSTTVISGSVAQPTGTSQRMWMAIVDVYIASTSSQKASMLSRQVTTAAGTLAGYVAGAMEIGGVGVSSEDTTTTKTFQVTAQPDTANSNLLLYAEAATLVKHPAP